MRLMLHVYRSRISLALCAAVLVGCASQGPVEVYTSDGKRGYGIDCSSEPNWESCHQRAAEICGTRGYDVMEKIGDSPSLVLGNRSNAAAGERGFIIRCKS